MARMNYEYMNRQRKVVIEYMPGRVPLPTPGRKCGGCGVDRKSFPSIKQFNDHAAACVASVEVAK